LLLIFRDVEKLRWLGGKKDERVPLKDGTFWFYLWGSNSILFIIVNQMMFLIITISKEPNLSLVYMNQYFGIVILFISCFIFLMKGFINPSFNFLASVLISTAITLIALIFSKDGYDFFIVPLYGFIGGIVIHQILKWKYKSGNRILWEIPGIWKIINNRWFLLGFTILFAIEMYFQLYQMSITTVWFF